MLALAHHFDELVSSQGRAYRARVYGRVRSDGRYQGFIVFFPAGGGRVISTDQETTQSTLDQLAYWASGLTHLYLHGALERALELQPEVQLDKELERLDYIEAAAEAEADTLQAAADVARAEARIAAEERDVAEEVLLRTVSETARTDARVHEAAAAGARKDARAADRALKTRTRKTAPKKK